MLNLLLKPIKIVKRIVRRIQTIIKWAPTIWKDEQWDQAYVFDILTKKLSLMESFYRGSDSMRADGEETADEIKEAITILNRIRKNEYLLIALEEFDKKYPDYNWSSWMETDENGHLKMDKDDTKDQKTMLKKAYKESDDAEAKDLDDLFVLLRKYIENWWD